ncbi:hypothetical protein DL764_007635 [Monosporascus ibericus]|uniref:DZF domain-containing protein n=1 Tax=Monosporascus ibericus TaxID=155417 RepID=A0A4Q4T305_9PEZI|nr:hypothetical protein DL764_007635 [Monosporascus ibericus]
MASSSGQPLNSNNPFRRKLGVVHPSSATPGSPAVSTPSDSTSTLTSASTCLDGQDPLSPPLHTAAPQPPFTAFSSLLPEDEGRERELHGDKDEPVQPKPRKIVKKVRVQSPPPSSPEDAVPVRSFQTENAYDDDDEDDSSSSTNSTDSRDREEDVDPFDNAASDTEDHKDIEQPLPRPPANPFSRTLKDSERSGQAHGRGQGQGQDAGTMPGHAAKGSLDVDSFKRLLLTGHANVSDPAPASGANLAVVSPLQPPPQDGASNTDESSVSRQSMADAIQETPRTSHEISEPEEPEGRRNVLCAPPSTTRAPSTSTRKKPPPPNSRHGKLIKIELGADSNAAAATRVPTQSISIGTSAAPSTEQARKASGQFSSIARSQSPASSISDINKPLPPPPSRAPTDEVESPFDREAAGKVPEGALLASPQQAAAAQQPQPPIPPPPPPSSSRGRSESQSSTQSRSKPAAPAPPPRRQTRTESKPPSVHAGSAEEDRDQSRSSLDSNRSRADSLRVSNSNSGGSGGGPAPAPPPRRRPNHARSGSSFAPTTQAHHGPVASFPVPMSPSQDGRRPVSIVGIPATPPQPERTGNLAVAMTSPKEGLPKISPPPLPPARHASTRRPPSMRVVGAEAGAPAAGIATTRKVSRGKDGVPMAPPPPPPPPRQRGSSRGDVEAAAGGGGGDDARKAGGDGEGKGTSTSPQTQPQTQTPSSSVDILTDLDVLQREVDALMARYPNVET